MIIEIRKDSKELIGFVQLPNKKENIEIFRKIVDNCLKELEEIKK